MIESRQIVSRLGGDDLFSVGKLTAKVEFGAKLTLSMEDDYSRIEMISWDAFNELKTLIDSCERYFNW